ncbi:MAG: hypothetical protein B7Z81_13020, partial [Acidocella sp. 20-61-6]
MLALLLLLAGAACPQQARAAAPAAPTTGDLNGLLQTLQNPGQRQALIGEIKTLIALRAAKPPAPQHQGPGDALVTFLSGEAIQVGAAVAALASLAPLAGLLAWAQHVATDPQLRMLWARGAGMVLAMLGAALLAGRGA